MENLNMINNQDNIQKINKIPNNVKMINPIIDKTGAIYLPYEKKLMRIIKNKVEETVELINVLPRERMLLRVEDVSKWNKGNKLEIHGKGVIFSCKVSSVNRNKKVVIKKVAENKLNDEKLNKEESEIIKDL